MAINTYEESFLQTIKNNSKTLLLIFVPILAIALIFVGINLYLGNGGGGQTTVKNLIRDYNIKIGKSDAKLKVLYLYDLQCPACKENNENMKSFTQAYQDKVQIIYKMFPLVDIHPFAKPAAYGAQAIAKQKQDYYFEYKDTVFANQLNFSNNAVGGGNKVIDDAAKAVNGVDFDKWNNDRNSKEIRDQVDLDERDVKNLVLPENPTTKATKLTGTPGTILIKDDKVVDWWVGGLPVDDMKPRVDKFVE